VIGLGHLGETAVYNHLVTEGFFVFGTFLDGSPFDFIIYNEGIDLKRIEVKSCTYKRGKSWRVSLTGGAQYLNSKNIAKKSPFDNTNSDILIIYLPIENTFLFFKSKEVTQKSSISINIDKLHKGEYCTNIWDMI